MGTNHDKDAETLAAEILRYLRSHRDAADTVEGIAHWWIKRQRIEEAINQVHLALDYLVEQGWIRTMITRSGTKLYMLPEPARVPRENGDEPGSL